MDLGAKVVTVEVGAATRSKTSGGREGEDYQEQTKSGLGCDGDGSITSEGGEEGIRDADSCGLGTEEVGESTEVESAAVGEWQELLRGGRVIHSQRNTANVRVLRSSKCTLKVGS